MLPLGRLSRRGPIGFERPSLFTSEEQKTLMTLWAIFRSPLMFGGDLSMIDTQTFRLITNEAVLAVNQNSTDNRQLFRRGNHVVWIANAPNSGDKYLAVFNLGPDNETPVYIRLDDLDIRVSCTIEDLWTHQSLGEFSDFFEPVIPSHGAGLFQVRQ
jgi:hypothetical protein